MPTAIFNDASAIRRAPAAERFDDLAEVRWMPHYALADGALIGACLAGTAVDAGQGEAGHRRIEAALNFVDGLLRHGCPLLLTVPVTRAELADPHVIARLEAWSQSRGGAHRLFGFDVAASNPTSPVVPWARLAELGYEVTLAASDLFDGSPVPARPNRIAIDGSLVRRAPREAAAAAEVHELAGKAEGLGCELMFRGGVGAEAEAWAKDAVRVPMTWRSPLFGHVRDAEGLARQVRHLFGRCELPVVTMPRRGTQRVHDLTWVDVV